MQFGENVSQAYKTGGIDGKVEDFVEIVDLSDGLRLWNGLPWDMIWGDVNPFQQSSFGQVF